jgi:polysaccharide export outer membrane protein
MIVLLLAAGLLPGTAAGQALPAPPDESCADASADARAYKLRVGTVLGIEFRFTPEFNTSATIRPDGRIAMSGIGDVPAAGLTTRQLTCALEEAYGAILRDPVINVSAREFENPSFIVGGEVERPGKYELTSDTTLTEAIAIAGGFRRSAKQSGVYLFRRDESSGEMAPRLLDVKAMLERRDAAQDFLLQSDDMVFVPESGFSRVERFIPLPGVGFFLPLR